jgi:hypothetical protein
VTGTVEAAHHRADGHPQHVSGLLVGQPVEVDQPHDPLELVRKRFERLLDRGVEGIAQGVLLCAVVRRLALEHPVACLGVPEQLGPATADAVHLRVAHDRQQPRSRIPAVEPLDRPVGPQQRVLDQVLGVCAVAGERHRDAQQDVELGQHVALERLVSRGRALAW